MTTCVVISLESEDYLSNDQNGRWVAQLGFAYSDPTVTSRTGRKTRVPWSVQIIF